MEMRYFWLLDAEAQQLFRFYYQPGQENLGDYPSKHHSADIHQHVRPYYVHMNSSPTSLPRAAKPSTQRGCAETLGDPYKGRIPLPSVPYYRARDLSRHLTRTANTPNLNRHEYFPNGNHMIPSHPQIVTE